MPRTFAAIVSLTLAIAFSTPLPPKRLGSPSRRSSASWMPVDAPDGTAAEPVAPPSRVTVTVIVGLPRESRISRAWTEAIVLNMTYSVARRASASSMALATASVGSVRRTMRSWPVKPW